MSHPIANNLKRRSGLKFSLSSYTVEVYHHLNETAEKCWGEFVDSTDSFLCTDYLHSLEDVKSPELELRYALFFENKKVVGLAAFQLTHFATSSDAYSNPLFCFLHKAIQFLRLNHVHNILICGNAISTGEHGFVFLNSVNSEQRMALLMKAMNTIAVEEKKKKRSLCAMVVKDFYPASSSIPKAFESYGFKSFCVDHNMVMPLLREWKSFEDYLQALTTRFRTKAKAAMKRSDSLDIRFMSKENIDQHYSELKTLYENVHYKADFRLGKMEIKSLGLMLERMPNCTFVKSYSLNGKIVGFMTAINRQGSLEAQIIGLDYTVNKEYAIYQRMLYDYISLGIKLNCHRIVFGRTAAEIKSSVGAFPVSLTCAIHHQKRISNALLKLIFRYIKPSLYEHRNPYKQDVIEVVKREVLN